MSTINICAYCFELIECNLYLTCVACCENVHRQCLRSFGTPGDLMGDVFFEFTCIQCSLTEKEIFQRKKLPWLMIVILTIYNLSVQSQGLGHHGFYHWKTHIANFVDKNWKFLFDSSVKQKKKWIGTISGVLSHHSPQFFTSGQEILHEPGWWKLNNDKTPVYYMQIYEESIIKKNSVKFEENITVCEDQSSSSDFPNMSYACSRLLPYMGKKNVESTVTATVTSTATAPAPSTSTSTANATAPSTSTSMYEQNINQMSPLQSNLLDFIVDNFPSPDPFLVDSRNNDFFNLPLSDIETTEPITLENNFKEIATLNEIPSGKNNGYLPRIVQITNFQEISCENSMVSTNSSDLCLDLVEDVVVKAVTPEPIHSVSSKFTKSVKRKLPWKEEETETKITDDAKQAFTMVSSDDENQVFEQLKEIFETEKQYKLDIPTKIRRLYRKMSISKTKSSNFMKSFTVDDTDQNITKTSRDNFNILDRFVHFIADSVNLEKTFNSRIVGSTDYDLFESPYTSRILKPFIYRNTECFPTWLKLICEIQYKLTAPITPTRSSIDFCYFRAYHIAGVNSLLQRIFWPGIDMSECLSYPDFTVVAMYKKLIIGCAFLVPDVNYNEAYISFMAVRPGWQRNGIASFMLYHLTQTCMGKDITLHVSATNPAVCLYQKFGFKIEEVALDFYDKYIPAQSLQSRHAFFLRLKR